MTLQYQENGNLIEGIHTLSIEEFEIEFGFNTPRNILIQGLKLGLKHLKDCGCEKVYVDGSFVTKKIIPGDFDACWDGKNVDFEKLINEYPIIVDFTNKRSNQKTLYKGEFFLCDMEAFPGIMYLDFFQKDRNGNSKGIIQINLK